MVLEGDKGEMMAVGYSKYSKTKMEHFSQFIPGHILRVAAIGSKWPNWTTRKYHFIDTTAGPGIHPLDEGGVALGSPLIGIQALKEAGIEYEAVLIEKDTQTFNLLAKSLPEEPNIHLHNGDNLVVIDRYIKAGKKKKLGIVYNDPNGVPHWEMLRKMSRPANHQKLDIVIHCNATAIKRAWQSPKAFCTEDLLTELGKIDKAYWLVREPHTTHQWSFLIGTNWNRLTAEMDGLFAVSSKRGKEILTFLCECNGGKNG